MNAKSLVERMRLWRRLLCWRLFVAAALATFVLTATFVEPRSRLVPFILAVGMLLLGIGHIGMAAFRCPRCGRSFVFSGDWWEDSHLAMARAYFGWKCASCRARIGSTDDDDDDLARMR